MSQTPEPSIPHCINCSYSLAGLDRDAKCPECGTAVVLSLPGVRMLKLASDTPWGWYAFVWRMMKNPRTFYLHVWIDPDWGLAWAIRMIMMTATQPLIVVLLYSLRYRLTFPARGEAVPDNIASALEIAVPAGVMLFVVMEIAAVMIRPTIAREFDRTPLIISQMITRYTTGVWMLGSGIFTLIASCLLLASWFMPTDFRNDILSMIIYLLFTAVGASFVLWVRIIMIGVGVFRLPRS